jgi:hypothetical protein
MEDVTNKVLLERPRIQVDDAQILSIGYDPEMWAIIVEDIQGNINSYAPFAHNQWDYFQNSTNKYEYLKKFILSNPRVELRQLYKKQTDGNNTESTNEPPKN